MGDVDIVYLSCGRDDVSENVLFENYLYEKKKPIFDCFVYV